MPKSNVKIIIIPGIFKREGLLNQFKLYCDKQNIDAEFFRIKWLAEGIYKANEKELLQKINDYSSEYSKIYLIGTSAGGSVAVNAFLKSNGLVSKVVCICAPLKEEGFTLALGELISDKFKDSLSIAVRSLRLLDKRQKEKILAFIPKYDELVPLQSMKFSGIRYKQIDSSEHLLSIAKVINNEIPVIASFLDLK